jgi:RNA polymerase sigma-70 factor (ECF subfamily)
MDASQEAALVQEFRSGNKEAFGSLYEAYIKPIYNFVYYKTHHKETAEDLTGQVFLKAYKSAGTYDPAKGLFSTWLYQIARRTVIDHYRTSKPALNIDDVWDLGSGEDVARDTETRLQLEKVKTYLKVLPAEQRDIVIMRLWQELSYAEIASVLGKSEASCKMMFSRTMQKLRAALPAATLVLLLVSLFKE